MVSKKFSGKNLALAFLSLALCATAYALSPEFAAIDGTLKGLKNANVDCSEYEGDPNKKQQLQDCKKCKQEVDKQKGDVEKKVSAAKAKDSGIEAKAQAGSAAGVAGSKSSSKQTGDFGGDKTNKNSGKDAKTEQSSNFADLAKALNSCKDGIEKSCQGEMEQKGAEGKQACEAAAKQAEGASAKSAADAAKMGEDAAKNAESGKGMEMPKMPEMPKQEPKQADNKSDISTAANTNTNTSTATVPATLSGSSLAGNQLSGSKIGIGGTDPASIDSSKTPSASFHAGNGGFGDSGISAGKSFENSNGVGAGGASGSGAGNFGGGGSGLGALGSSSGDSGSSHAGAAPTLPPKTDDIEAFSNGGSRPSYLGMKSKGGELADLGLDGAASTSTDSGTHSGDADRSLASTDQNAGIHTEAEAGSLFMMVRERLKEVGRRGAI